MAQRIKNSKKADEKIHRAKLIYNPFAGTKRRMLPNPHQTSLEDIKLLLDQYQIPVDFFPTKGPGHATKLAQEAVKEGYETVLVAGGDGTAGEVANGLINTNIKLGILPLGSFMNIARMVSIPTDLEKAVALIKIGRTRKIDIGMVTSLGGKELKKPYGFIESCGLGLEAQLHKYVLDFERGKYGVIWQFFKTLREYYGHPAVVTIDDQVIKTRAILINISNGPFSGAALAVAPEAKLNDHKLTVSLFRMSKFELFKYFFNLFRGRPVKTKKISSYQGSKVTVTTKLPRLVHADARLYGETPIEVSIVPNALTVITGFPKPDEVVHALQKRNYLDP